MVAGIMMNSGPTGRFFFNLSQDVGPGCPNAADDVEFVRFGYYCMGTNPQNTLSPAANKAAYAAVPLQGPFDAQLQQVIRLHQAERGGAQDGKVSTIKNASGSYGERSWILVPLNNNMIVIVRS